MLVRGIMPLALALSMSLSMAGSLSAAGRVELELVTAAEFPRFETQKWYRLLTDLKIKGLRIRSIRPSDKLEIVTGGSKSSPVYRVKGMLTARGELALPGGKKFTLRDGSRLASWLKGLREFGPDGTKKVAAFGLTPDQFEAVRKDLAQAIAFSTKGKTRAEVLKNIAGRLNHQTALHRGARDALKEAGDLSEELKGISFGTALACLLRPAGLGLAPSRLPGGKVRFDIRAGLSEKQAWPVGLSAQDQRRKLLPGLFDFLDVEIDKGTSMATALDSISAKLKAPILLDHNALAELNIELSKATVTVPPRRTTLSILISRLLRAANPRLITEMRIDEANKPFIWVTVFRRQ